MRRALILIIVLTALTFGCGFWLDHRQSEMALEYLAGIHEIRTAVLEGRMQDASVQQAYLHAMWQHESIWLNCLISHHHTRDVSSALLKLATGLEMESTVLSLMALDEAQDALEEVAVSDRPTWENIL